MGTFEGWFMNKTSHISEEMLVSPVMLYDSSAVFCTDLDSVQSGYPSVLFSPGTVTLGDNTFRDFSDNISYVFSNAPADYTVRSIDKDEDMIVLTDLWCRYRDEIAKKERQKLEMYRAYRKRIEALRGYAALDNFVASNCVRKGLLVIHTVNALFPTSRAGAYGQWKPPCCVEGRRYESPRSPLSRRPESTICDFQASSSQQADITGRWD